LIVIVFAAGSRSWPPLAVPPLSWTWNVKAASGEPLALAGGGLRGGQVIGRSFFAGTEDQ
jgi:hypothetical protein